LLPSGKISPPKNAGCNYYFFGNFCNVLIGLEKNNALSKIPCLKKIIKFPRKTYTEDFSLKID
jgi:hypothetical protein